MKGKPHARSGKQSLKQLKVHPYWVFARHPASMSCSIHRYGWYKDVIAIIINNNFVLIGRYPTLKLRTPDS
jgi:hypothetical protein